MEKLEGSEDNVKRDARLDKIEDSLQPKRKPRDLTFVVRYYETVRESDGRVHDVEVPIPESEYETSDWRVLENGDRVRVKDRRNAEHGVLGPEP